MKLLKKSEIAKAQAEDKRREIEEGLRISRKVDALRELWASEEQAFEKWRTKILEEIKELSEKRDALKKEDEKRL